MLGISSKLYKTKQISKMLRYTIKCQKAMNLLKQLKAQQLANRASHPNNHHKFVQLLTLDACSSVPKFAQYEQVRHLFQLYLLQAKNKIEDPSNNYNPYLIKDQAARFSQLMDLVSKYPQFNLNSEQVRSVYQIFCRHLSSKNDQQMNRALKFALKVDGRAEQSVIYEQFLKFYLGEKLEVLKAKYQLNFKQESIGNLIKGMASSLIHRGFLRRSPSYSRKLQITEPSQILKLIIENKSTKQSLMIRKIICEQIFKPVVNYYQQVMHSNLYHEKNVELWEMLNKNVQTIFNQSRNILLEKQCEYLRELYILLYLVLGQQQKGQEILKYFSKLTHAYDYFMKNQYDSEKVSEFCSVFKQFANGISQKNINLHLQTAELDHTLFNMMKNFDHLSSHILNRISECLVPLTFSVFFNQLKQIYPKWNKQVYEKLSLHNQQNLMCLLQVQQLLQLTNMLDPQKGVGIYNQAIHLIVNRDYKDQIPIKNIVAMLKIYAKHKEYKTQNEELKMLRIFLFRYISDHKSMLNLKQLQEIIRIVLDLQDYSKFSDDQGNYDMNIYEQLANTKNRYYLVLPAQLKDKLESKIEKPNKNVQNTIAQLMNKIRK